VRLVMARLRLCGVKVAEQLKDIFCIHVEACPAGELKHGLLALVAEEKQVIDHRSNKVLLE
jgi:glucosamine 6-phosphate synthetase-like amidotransferase/phosphosugar isomerase protein